MSMELDIAATESLRDFARAYNEIEFSHLCTTAIINGEEWAVIRISGILAEISKYSNREAATLLAISNADTAFPDGSIALALVYTIDTAAIGSLRELAFAYDYFAFAHLCTAALLYIERYSEHPELCASDDVWTVERIAPAVRVWNSSAMAGKRSAVLRLDAIRATDTSRPDGAIARSFEV